MLLGFVQLWSSWKKESLLCCVNVLSYLIEIEKVCLDLLTETFYPFFVCVKETLYLNYDNRTMIYS